MKVTVKKSTLTAMQRSASQLMSRQNPVCLEINLAIEMDDREVTFDDIATRLSLYSGIQASVQNVLIENKLLQPPDDISALQRL